MKIDTHTSLAKIAIDKVQTMLPEWDISKAMEKSIMFGAIEADFNPVRFLKPHYYTRSGEKILSSIDNLLEKRLKLKPVEIGIIVHYLQDFCCYAHFGENAGDLQKHIEYEKKLKDAFYKNVFQLTMLKVPVPNKEDTVEFIKYLIEKYRKEVPSVENDLLYALNTLTVFLFKAVQAVYDYDFVLANPLEERFVAV